VQLRRRQTNLVAAESVEPGYLLTGYDQYERNFEIACDALLFAAAVAMRTERIRIGFAVVQLPFHHPVLLAVQLALLDNLSKGDVGVGKARSTTSTNLSITDYFAAVAGFTRFEVDVGAARDAELLGGLGE